MSNALFKPSASSVSAGSQPKKKSISELFAKPRIVLAIDATGSQQPSWDMTSGLTHKLIADTGNVSMQLVYYQAGYCKSSRWFDSAASVKAAMASVRCVPGMTQVNKVLRHAIEEHAKAKLSAVIFIGDAFEENPEQIYATARELKAPCFCFQVGNRDDVAGIFAKIASITGGASAQFDAGAADKLGNLLKAAATFASGGTEALALEAKNSAAARLLLTQMKK